MIRINRAITATFVAPQHPMIATAISEIASTAIPLINPDYRTKVMNIVLFAFYSPNYLALYINLQQKKNEKKRQIELYSLLLVNVLSFFYIF